MRIVENIDAPVINRGAGHLLGLNARIFAVGTATAYAVLCIALTPEVFAGRFWAEEGRPYYATFQTLGLWDQLTYTRGYLQLFTNVAVALARLAGHAHAPLVTTFLGFAVQLLLVGLICVWHERLGINRLPAFLLAVILAVMPHMGEAWANTTNAHWLAAAIACLILIAPAKGTVPYRVFGGATLFLAGLSGVPAALLVPAFALKTALSRDRAATIQFLLLLAAALIQAMLLVTGGEKAPGPRYYPTAPDLYVAALSAQSFGTQFFGFGTGHRIAEAWAAGSPISCLIGVVSLSAIGGLFALGLAQHATRQRSILLMVAFVFSVVGGIFGSLGPPENLVSGSWGGRYFLVPNIILLLMVAQLASSSIALRYISVAVLGLMIYIHTRDGPVPAFAHGPSWSAQLPDGPIESPLVVTIWPPDWQITLLPE